MFEGASVFNQALDFDMDSVIDIGYMFSQAQLFNAGGSNVLSAWNVDRVQYAEHAFDRATWFDRDLCAWGAKAKPKDVRDVDGMFEDTHCASTEDPWFTPSGVPNMCGECTSIFAFDCFADGSELRAAVDNYLAGGSNRVLTEAAFKYGKNIGDWCVMFVEDFSWVFAFTGFSGDLSQWDVSSATDMSFMFYGNDNFNGDLRSWDVSKVQDMVRRKIVSLRDVRNTKLFLLSFCSRGACLCHPHSIPVFLPELHVRRR